MPASVTSPNSDDHTSIFVTPGKWSFVNCGKSSSVSSPVSETSMPVMVALAALATYARPPAITSQHAAV